MVKDIYIIDNFLSKKLFNVIKEKAKDFEKVTFENKEQEKLLANKSFWVKLPSKELIAHFEDKLSVLENKEVVNVLSFFRQAKENQDDDWRIHNDGIIMGEQPHRAIVFYVDSEDDKKLNGTAFWEHVDYGDSFTNIDNEDEFNDLMINQANDLNKWKLKSVVGYKPNRLLSYPCNYFHSKYPNEFKKSRVVFVMFYKVYEK